MNREPASSPLQAMFFQALGHHEAGRLGEAEALYLSILRADQRHADAWHMLGLLALQIDRPAIAEGLIGKAIGLKEGVPDFHNHLGSALFAQGKIEAAEAAFRHALVGRPTYAEAHFNLGSLLQAQGRPADALAAFDAALAQRPDFAEAQSNRGNILQEQGRLAEAFVSYCQALRHKPALAGVWCNLANVLQMEGDLDGAVGSYRRALICQPDLAEALCNLGSALRDLGQFDCAMTLYRRAIESDPDRAKFHYGLAEIKRFTEEADPALARMERLAEGIARLPAEEQVNLHFALGKAYDDLGEHDPAFAHFLAGNRLKRGLIGYDEAAELAQFDRIKAAFADELPQNTSSVEGPIFILGMPRSGTSLIEQILASHPSVFGAGELPLLGAIFPDLSVEDLQQRGERYRAALKSKAPDALRITDKLPQNFLACGLIHLALPDARIIHVRRDPIDTCLSCFSKLFTTGHPYSYDLAELGRYYRRYQSLMEHWRRVLPEGRMLEVRYEDVVEDLEGQARRILSYCGLAWDPACLAFAETKRPVRTASATQVRQPLYRSSIGRWRPEPDVIKSLTDQLGS